MLTTWCFFEVLVNPHSVCKPNCWLLMSHALVCKIYTYLLLVNHQVLKPRSFQLPNNQKVDQRERINLQLPIYSTFSFCYYFTASYLFYCRHCLFWCKFISIKYMFFYFISNTETISNVLQSLVSCILILKETSVNSSTFS